MKNLFCTIVFTLTMAIGSTQEPSDDLLGTLLSEYIEFERKCDRDSVYAYSITDYNTLITKTYYAPKNDDNDGTWAHYGQLSSIKDSIYTESFLWTEHKQDSIYFHKEKNLVNFMEHLKEKYKKSDYIIIDDLKIKE